MKLLATSSLGWAQGKQKQEDLANYCKVVYTACSHWNMHVNIFGSINGKNSKKEQNVRDFPTLASFSKAGEAICIHLHCTQLSLFIGILLGSVSIHCFFFNGLKEVHLLQMPQVSVFRALQLLCVETSSTACSKSFHKSAVVVVIVTPLRVANCVLWWGRFRHPGYQENGEEACSHWVFLSACLHDSADIIRETEKQICQAGQMLSSQHYTFWSLMLAVESILSQHNETKLTLCIFLLHHTNASIPALFRVLPALFLRGSKSTLVCGLINHHDSFCNDNLYIYLKKI